MTRMKKRILVVGSILLCFVFTQVINAQLLGVNKSFTNEDEWRLTFRLGDAYFSNSYNYCSKCMDELMEMTNEIDEIVIRLAISCYDKTHQTHKIKKLADNGFLDVFNPSQLCDFELSEESRKLAYFEHCSGVNTSKKEFQLEEATKPKLQERLINMLIADQYYRSLGMNDRFASIGYEIHNDYLENSTMRQLDSVNFIALNEIFNTNGFPTRQEVGKWAMQAVFLIMQHSAIDFQLEYKDQITKAYENNDLHAYNYATMIDRMEVNQGKKQIFGTQDRMNDNGESILCPLIDPENVNERRMKIGLIPIEKYLALYNVKME